MHGEPPCPASDAAGNPLAWGRQPDGNGMGCTKYRLGNGLWQVPGGGFWAENDPPGGPPTRERIHVISTPGFFHPSGRRVFSPRFPHLSACPAPAADTDT